MVNVHCLVFEPDVTGHRLQHVRHLTDALLSIGCDVTLAQQTDCRDHAEFNVHLKELEPHVRLFARLVPDQRTTLAARRRRVAELLETIEALRPDWVYVPYADGITQTAALVSQLHGSGPFCRVPIEGQIMRGKYGYPSQSVFEAVDSAANRWLTRRSPWHVTHVLDPIALRGLGALPHPDAFQLIPEPVEPLPELDRREARQTLGVPIDGRYLAVVGGLNIRKRFDLLLAAFDRAKLRADDRLLLVGKMTPQVRELIHDQYGHIEREGRIATVDRYVSDHELDCGFLAADVVAVTHPRQIGSSGTLVRGVAADRPVLASDFGWVDWVTNTFQLGTTVDVADTDRFAAAIEHAFDAAGQHHRSEAARRFCEYHTTDNQKAHWVAAIGRQLSLPLANKVDWSWVLDAKQPAHTFASTTPASRGAT